MLARPQPRQPPTAPALVHHSETVLSSTGVWGQTFWYRGQKNMYLLAEYRRPPQAIMDQYSTGHSSKVEWGYESPALAPIPCTPQG